MKRKTLKRFIPFLVISAVIAIAAIVMACAYADMDNYPPSFFAPETIHSERYYPFFRSFYPLYENNYKEDYRDDFNVINITEWDSYFAHGVKKNDLEQIVYKYRLGEIDTLIFNIKKPEFPLTASLKNNSILHFNDKRTALDFLFYIGFAKRCEKYATYVPDPWTDYGTDKKATNPRDDKATMTTLEEGGVKQITNVNSDFVKQRYIFQLIRLYFMSGDYDKCTEFYTQQQNVLESNANSMKYRSMGYAAAAYHKQKKYGNADYLYSLIYAQYDSMKVSAYFSFHPQEESDWNQTLSLAKTPQEKITLWQMLGIYKDAFRAMKEIYAIDPKSEMLDLMLVRTVSKVEEQQFTEDDGWAYNPRFKDTAINNEVVSFITKTADKGGTHLPYEWDLAAGYVGWLAHDKTYDKYLTKAEKETTGDSLVQQQVRLIRLLAKVQVGKADDEKFENEVADELFWLRNQKHTNYLRTQSAYSLVMAMLANKYKDAGDEVKFACLSGLPDDSVVIHNDALLNKVIAYIDKPKKTSFDEYAIAVLGLTKGDLMDVQAVKLLYQYKFKEALAKLQENPDGAYRGPLYGDPFVIHINDCHDCDANDSKKTKYTRYGFIQRMIELQADADKNPANAANDYFLLANGYYNMTYFGNNRVLYQTARTDMSNVGWSYISEDKPVIDTTVPYNNCTMALQYYVKAMQASKDPEFEAKCCFMAAKCEQNTFFCNIPKDYKGDFKSGEYFRELKRNYANTQYFEEVIQECGYFKLFSENYR